MKTPGFSRFATVGTRAAIAAAVNASSRFITRLAKLGFVGVVFTSLGGSFGHASPRHFDSWTAGRIQSVDAGQRLLVLRVDAREAVENFHWDQESRLWRTGGPKDGQPVEATKLKVGEAVQILFRKSSGNESPAILRIVESGAAN